jgi:hypothetical protein
MMYDLSSDPHEDNNLSYTDLTNGALPFILDASVFPVATRTPSTVGTEALRIERGAPFGSGSRRGPGSFKPVVIAHLRMLSNTHWARIRTLERIAHR